MFQIRQCGTEDFNDVVRLPHQLWPDQQLDTAVLQAVFDRALVGDAQVYLCATDGQRVMGFSSLTLKNNLRQQGYLAHVDELVVDSEYRGRGIGTRLLEQLVTAAWQRGRRRVELDSAFHRKQAHQFYEQHGFAGRALLFSRVL